MLRLAVIDYKGEEEVTVRRIDKPFPNELKNDRTDIYCEKERLHVGKELCDYLFTRKPVAIVMSLIQKTDDNHLFKFFRSIAFYYEKYKPTKLVHEVEIINQLLENYRNNLRVSKEIKIDIVMLDNGEKAFAYESVFGIKMDGTEVILTGKEKSCMKIHRKVISNPPDKSYVFPEGFKKIIQNLKLTDIEPELKELYLTDINDFLMSALKMMEDKTFRGY